MHQQSDNQHSDYRRIEAAISYIEDNFRTQPTLAEIAASVSLSKHHFNRMFKRWAGISPKQFLRFLTLEYTKQQLDRSRSVLDAAHAAGLSGPGRLHDLFVGFEAVTPGQYKRRGRGVSIRYGFGASPFGECLLAATARGICHLSFIQGDEGGTRGKALELLRRSWPGADFSDHFLNFQNTLDSVFSPDPARLSVHVLGTNFQVNVWKALLKIPEGTVVSYGDLAAFMGRARSTRAVAGAVAANTVGWLIPCHRVITASGKTHKYRWGSARKKAMIGWEAARAGNISADRPERVDAG